MVRVLSGGTIATLWTNMTGADDRENRYRLEQVLHVCELHLQLRTQRVWNARKSQSTTELTKGLLPFQRDLLAKSDISAWDISMCNAVLKRLNALTKKKEIIAVDKIVSARNLCAHAPGGCVTRADFEYHADQCMQALRTLGGDTAALQRARTCEIDASDLRTLAASASATAAAEKEKTNGNRLFREKNYRGAIDCYTRGLQVAGVVDTNVMAQLHNNRATAHHKLGHLEAVREDAQRATELQPQWGQPQIRLAEMYYDKGKYQKAVTRLEIALGLANAAHDRAMVQDIESKLATYRFDNAQVQRRESENLAYGPTRDAEGAFRAAAQAMQGLDPSEDPMALLHKWHRWI